MSPCIIIYTIVCFILYFSQRQAACVASRSLSRQVYLLESLVDGECKRRPVFVTIVHR